MPSKDSMILHFHLIDAEGQIATRNMSLNVVSKLFSTISYYGDIQNWEPNNDNYWTILRENANNKYAITTTNLNPIDNKLAAYSLVKDRTFENFKMTLKVKSPEDIQQNNAADFAIVFDFQDDNNYYYFILNATAAWSAVHKIENGVRKDLATANFAFSDNQYHDFELSKINKKLLVKYDNTIILNAISDLGISGKIGIGSLNDAAYFDDIDIQALQDVDTTAPAVPQNVKANIQESN